jgi:transposase
MSGRRKSKRKYRKYSPEFKREALGYYKASGKSAAEVARELDIPKTNLMNWIKQAEIDEEEASSGPLTSAERKELLQLRKDLKRVRMERDFLKKATAFFANQKP